MLKNEITNDEVASSDSSLSSTFYLKSPSLKPTITIGVTTVIITTMMMMKMMITTIMIMIMAFKSVSHHNWDCSRPIPEKFTVSKVDVFLDDDGDGEW